MNNEQRRVQRAFIETLNSLPSLPSIISRVLELIHMPLVSADDVAILIKQDPGLSATILRCANSAFYGMPRTIRSVTSAVVVLGFQSLQSIILRYATNSLFADEIKKTNFDFKKFWFHSSICAYALRLLVQACSKKEYIPIDVETAFCAGMLHDIGKLVMVVYDWSVYEDVYSYAASMKATVFESEHLVLGITHADIGKIIAQKWNLPKELEICIHYHHTVPVNEKSDVSLVASLCIYANYLAHQVSATMDKEEIFSVPEQEVYSNIPLGADELNRVEKKVYNSLEDITEFFKLVSYE